MSVVAMTDTPQVLVITPAVDGVDGVSEVSRQAVAAIAAAWGPDAVEVWTLSGRRGSDARVAGVRLRTAGGGRATMSAWALCRTRRALDGTLVLVLHAHLAPLALMLALRGARVAVFLHGIEAWTPLRRRESTALDRASLLLANSHHTAARFRDANPRFASRDVAVCHLGVGPRCETPVHPVIEGYVLIVGRLVSAERYKGHDALIDAWPAVCARVPNARLVVVGDGDDRARLESLVRNRGVADRVVFTGRVPADELAGWYEHAALFAMPSTAEGFGLVYVEAMRAGKTCLAAPGAAQEILVDGVTGIVVDPGARDRLADVLVRLFADRDACERMGRAGAARVASTFEERHFAARLLAQLAPVAAQVA